MRLFSLGLVAALVSAPLLMANSVSSGSGVPTSTGSVVTSTSDIFNDLNPSLANSVSDSIKSDLNNSEPDSLFHILPCGSSVLFYFLSYRGKNLDQALPDSVDYSVSSVVNSDSVTGYSESYVKGTLNKVGDPVQWSTGSTFDCYAVKYRVDGVFFGTARRIMVRQFYRNLNGTETAIAVSTQYVFSEDYSSYASTVFEHVEVSDKYVGFFNAYDGDTNLASVAGSLFHPYGKLFQQHFIAFNLDTTIDSILDVDIQTYWDTYYGETNIGGGGSDTDCNLAIDYHDLKGLCKDSFVHKHGNGFVEKATSSNGVPLFDKYHVEHNKKSFRDVFFGQTVSNVYYDAIMDLQNDSGTLNTIKQFFGIETYSSLFSGTSVVGDDGKPKFRWFVNYAENEIQAEKVQWETYTNGGTWFDNVLAGYPFRMGLQTTVVAVDYTRLGGTHKAVVVDVPKDSDPNPTSVFKSDGYTPGQKTPASNLGTLPEWAKILIALALACAAVSVLSLFFPVIKLIVKGIVLGLKVFFQVLIEIPYLVLVYPILCLVKGIKKEPMPKFWIFGDSSGGNS